MLTERPGGHLVGPGVGMGVGGGGGQEGWQGQNAQHMVTYFPTDLSGASFGPHESRYANTAAP